MTDQPENDGFDELVNGNKDETPPELSFQTITEAIQKVYPHLYDGILIRSILIMDRVDREGNRELRWVHGPDAQPWEVLGMVQQVLHDIEAENNFAISNAIQRALSEDDDDEDNQ